jgi:hypothetical protein
MRRARFLGLRDDEGNPEAMPGEYEVGDVLTVFPRFPGYTGPFPWADKPNEDGKSSPAGTSVFRENEIELLPEKELDLNDYL